MPRHRRPVRGPSPFAKPARRPCSHPAPEAEPVAVPETTPGEQPGLEAAPEPTGPLPPADPQGAIPEPAPEAAVPDPATTPEFTSGASSIAPRLKPNGEFEDPILEAQYKKYTRTNPARGQPVRDRLSWKREKEREAASSAARGNDFNKSVNARKIYPYIAKITASIFDIRLSINFDLSINFERNIHEHERIS